jgi:hypothetical protein
MDSYAQTDPNIAHWIKTHGWIEVGADGISDSCIGPLDEGVWSGRTVTHPGGDLVLW